MDKIGTADFDWQITEELAMSPFAHPADLPYPPIPLDRKVPWKTGALITKNPAGGAAEMERAFQLGAQIVLTPTAKDLRVPLRCHHPDGQMEDFPEHAHLMVYHGDPCEEILDTLRVVEQGMFSGAKSILVVLPLDDRFLVSIAKLRALRITAELLLAQSEREYRVVIGALTNHELMSGPENLVALTARATAAACVADIVLVADGSDYSLLLQHILRLEGGLGSTEDPVAGSYYLESLTDLIGAKAWDQFKQEHQ